MNVTAADLLAVPQGTITEAGLRQNINVGIGYLEAWLRGTGCVPLYHLMEDAATAEISRAQVWQWIRHKAKLADGRTIDLAALPRRARRGAAEAQGDGRRRGLDQGPLPRRGARSSSSLIEAPHFPEWLTIPAYDKIIAEGA